MSARLKVTLLLRGVLCALEDEAGLDLNFMKRIIILKTLPVFLLLLMAFLYIEGFVLPYLYCTLHKK